jgi:hypothetical protein
MGSRGRERGGIWIWRQRGRGRGRGERAPGGGGGGGGGWGGGELAVSGGAEGAGGAVALPPGGGGDSGSFVSTLSLLKPGTIDEAAACKNLRKLPSLGALTGRVALTPGCQGSYMDHTGCHQI